MKAGKLGKYIVTDPEVCHGQPTFQGTRILVRTVLEMVAEGTDWDTIVKRWGGRITKKEIGEAVSLASKAWLARQPAPEPEMADR